MTTSTLIKINQKDWRQFFAILPDGLKNEHYQFLNLRFSIARALYVIETYHLMPDTANRAEIEQIAKTYGVAYSKPESGRRTFSLFDRSLNDKWIAELLDNPQSACYSLSERPIIFVQKTVGQRKDKKQHSFLIDGGHRLRYHYLQGTESMPLIVIPEDYAHFIAVSR